MDCGQHQIQSIGQHEYFRLQHARMRGASGFVLLATARYFARCQAFDWYTATPSTTGPLNGYYRLRHRSHTSNERFLFPTQSFVVLFTFHRRHSSRQYTRQHVANFISDFIVAANDGHPLFRCNTRALTPFPFGRGGVPQLRKLVIQHARAHARSILRLFAH